MAPINLPSGGMRLCWTAQVLLPLGEVTRQGTVPIGAAQGQQPCSKQGACGSKQKCWLSQVKHKAAHTKVCQGSWGDSMCVVQLQAVPLQVIVCSSRVATLHATQPCAVHSSPALTRVPRHRLRTREFLNMVSTVSAASADARRSRPAQLQNHFRAPGQPLV